MASTNPTPKPTEPKKMEDSATRVVRYAGKGSERRLSTEDFKRHGVEDQDDARWHNGNGYMVPVSHFSDAALEVVLAQPGLDIVKVDANGTQV